MEVEREIIDFVTQHPVFCAIAEHMGELAREMSKLPERTPQWIELEQRFRKLEAYLGPMYDKSKAEQNQLILAFAQSLITGVFGVRRGQEPQLTHWRRVTTWEEVRRITDKFAERIRKRPKGNPIKYRPRILEGLEMKLAHPTSTYDEIAEELDLDPDDFKRQVHFLRKALHEEGIPVQQPEKTTKSGPAKLSE